MINEVELLARIACDPAILCGKPVVQDTRLSVDFLLNLLGHGMTESELLVEYPNLQHEDLQACFLFAAQSLSTAAFLPLTAGTP